MRIESIQSGPLAVNSYLLTDEESGACAVIDPGQNNRRLLDYLRKNGTDLRYILCTHGHFDHTADVAAVKELYPAAQIAIHPQDEQMLYDDEASLFLPFCGQTSKPAHADLLLADGMRLTLGKGEISVIETPGHTKGGVTFLCEENLFTGDALFYHSIGRTDFPGGDLDILVRSVKRLFGLPGNYAVYPGHERMSDLDDERKNNPFVITDIGRKA